MEDVIAVIAYLLPVILVAFIIRWIRLIRLNTEKQIQQNEEIIELLKKNLS
ncbi:hypothetical protein [Tenuibacillus multivorans]|uniref:Uncharacterized protein n=1 Tax=Tenuibacillus multivorans TaxID=237069 RepID=A0A1H0EFR9_9BACI|nr:hypothetical protein [Tenuibacillus multivorans]GEL77174.1 hypothetical protein TMU01_14090 [Tenuibacillus multivorans]SDN81294.1 hypothetical protein SAMN05216498_3136 [Tenuibacillus multivorans]